MKVRACVQADVPAVQAIYAQHVLHGFGTFEEDPPPVQEMERRFESLRSAGFPFVVAELDGRIAGYAYAGPFRARAAYRYTCESSVYIAPDMQRRGIGRALMQEVIAACRREELREMLALIGDSENHASIGLHRHLGFEHVGTFRNVGCKFGRWVDVVLMQLSLS